VIAPSWNWSFQPDGVRLAGWLPRYDSMCAVAEGAHSSRLAGGDGQLN